MGTEQQIKSVKADIGRINTANAQAQLQKWIEEIEKIEVFNPSKEQKRLINLKTFGTIKKATKELIQARGVIDEHYNMILGAVSCRMYYRERKDIGCTNMGPGLCNDHAKQFVPNTDVTSFISSIGDPGRRNEYSTIVADMGARYFYVWGLDSMVNRGHLETSERDRYYDKLVDDNVYYNPYISVPPVPNVSDEERAKVFVKCVKNAMNAYLHANTLADEVFHKISTDLDALDRVLTLSQEQRDFLRELGRFGMKLNPKGAL